MKPLSKTVVVPHVRGAMDVYFARPVGAVGPIKIGASRNPSRRMRDLSRYSPVPVELIHSLPGSLLCERRINRHFAKDRLHHEWFNASEELLAFIDKLRAGTPVGDLIPGLDPLQVGDLRRYRTEGEN